MMPTCSWILARRDSRTCMVSTAIAKMGSGLRERRVTDRAGNRLLTIPIWVRCRGGGDAPAGADFIRVAFEGTVIDEPIQDGVYLLVWWRVPYPSEWPRVIA